MGFWGSLGKGLLKAAPIATAFIPGVGPLASMAIGAGTSALSKKLEGGSWGDALKAGGIGGAMGYAGGKLGGIGPSKIPSTGIKGALGNIGKGVLGGGDGWQGALGQTIRGAIPAGGQAPQMNPAMAAQGIGPSSSIMSPQMNEMGPQPQFGGFQAALAGGQQEAMEDPLRRMLRGPGMFGRR